MDFINRIKTVARLGTYILEAGETLETVKEKAAYQNAWFTKDNIEMALGAIATQWLNEQALLDWASPYSFSGHEPWGRTVGIVMAGNIPLVGFHDFLCTFIAGNRQAIKLSSKDNVLLPHLCEVMMGWEPSLEGVITFKESIGGCHAYIATGSSNSKRYFEYYFSKYPNLLRESRTSIAILDGTETKKELEDLALDTLAYFGMGCRNVTKLYVPDGYAFDSFAKALEELGTYQLAHSKYRNNFDYQMALLALVPQKYVVAGPVILMENESYPPPISVIHYQYYEAISDWKETMRQEKEKIQCIIGRGYLPFGTAQSPGLTDYADGVDTLSFLQRLR